MTSEKKIWVALIAVAIIAIGGYFFPLVKSAVSDLGSAGTRFQHGISVNTNTAPASNGFKLGDNGTEMTKFISGTCDAITIGADSFVASSTRPWECAVTGATSGDKVYISLPTNASGNNGAGVSDGGGFIVVGAGASTTAGYITFNVWNATGASTTTYPQATTSVQYTVVR